ncbi:nuclear transport factor 2 family protein [Prauserella cavernicola]|uniref:Nuclear transport factor 2 family protein n=1 Tax=Prauserella cavernicola TaxID=2800127 RepID=A0A934V3L7_9PSEU|nr:nuclear transport factor 2 family protein [Prauserella cavernicola]MBK1783175.1 nuclear transport factor 2 family protein [Prauserella cavernicola]
MTGRPLPPVAVVVSFIDRINHADVPGLTELMTDDHRLLVAAEPPVVGRQATAHAWSVHTATFPGYVIHPRELAERHGRVAVAGHITGSGEGRRRSVLWLAEVRDGLVATWQVLDDTPDARAGLGLRTPPG